RMDAPAPSPSRVLDRLDPAQRDVASGLGRRFRAAGHDLHLVGGIVRDALIPRDLPADLDFTTSAPPPESKRQLEEAGAAAVYTVGERFGTIGAVFGEDPGRVQAEVTTYRAEHYPDATRFPSVRFGVSLDEDLSRRDFTCNAIAADPLTGLLRDPFGGEGDIAQGMLRAVGTPGDRFAEDPLRLLRAARFVSQLGFALDRETEAAMILHASDLRRISVERILAELTLLLTGDYAANGLETLRRTGLLETALPELAPLAAEAAAATDPARREKALWDHTLRVVSQSPPRPTVRWAALMHDAAKPMTRGFDASGEVCFIGHERAGADLAARALRRLRADRALAASVQAIVELHGRPASYEPGWTDSAVRRLALEAGPYWDDLLDLAAADVTSAHERKQARAAARVAGLRAHFARLEEEAALDLLQSPLDGDDLMALFGRPPGIWIKHVKAMLRDLVIDGDLAQDDRAAAGRLARDFLAANPDL
ncbi:MAG: CCA tRNA nucleotidyltransferase, partial [Chloroflexota bacterium]